MNTFDEKSIENNARTLNAILREDFGWQDENFVDELAPIKLRWDFKKKWSPKMSPKAKASKNSAVKTAKHVTFSSVIDRMMFVRFSPPDSETFASMNAQRKEDLRHWAGYFEREVSYKIDVEEYDEEQHKDFLDTLRFSSAGRFDKSNIDYWFGVWLLGSWTRFRNYSAGGFTVRFLDAPILACMPSDILWGAEWISVAPVNKCTLVEK